MCSSVSAALFLLLVAGTSRHLSAEEAVQIRQSEYDQFVTSSTLTWVPGSDGSFPNNSVVGSTEILPEGENPEEDPDEETETPRVRRQPRVMYVCRARHNGVWVAGSLLPETGYCHISLLGDVERKTQYQVLQNIDGSARLSWNLWDRFTAIDTGAVGSGEAYVARRQVQPEDEPQSGFSHYLGKLDANDGLGRLTVVTQDGREKGYQDGEVLVETEPLRYELSGVKFITRRRRERPQTVVLATGVLRNGAATIPVEVDQAMQYSYMYSLYWGQGRATLKGLPTIVRNASGSIVGQIKWGIEEKVERKSIFTVKYLLEPGTAVNVTLLGNNTDTETPYMGKLVAFFSDGSHRARAINGSRREIDMLGVRADYSPAYYLKNNSLVPTTSTTTTTTTTTTTVQPPVTVTELPAATKKPPKPMKPDLENEINRGHSSMQADEALSLQKENGSKQERGVTMPDSGGSNSTGALQASMIMSLITLVASVAITHRIT